MKTIFKTIFILMISLLFFSCNAFFDNLSDNQNESNRQIESGYARVEIAVSDVLSRSVIIPDFSSYKDNIKSYSVSVSEADNILNSDSSFAKYTFITNNSIYIFDPEKLDKGVFEYKKVFDIPSSIKVMTIDTSYGSDISFIDYNDTKYTLVDENTDNNVIDSYSMFEKAIYNKLNNNLKWEYSNTFLGKKMNYDFVSVYAIYKDNKLYSLNYGNEKYPVLDEIEIKDKNEKVIRIYNDRIVKTDKNFYELMSYFDTNQNKTVTMLVKIKSLSKYYSEVLTFTYKYVVLKDFTIIPIDDVMESRIRPYTYDNFLSGFNSIDEVHEEE